jgi:ATP-dependent DNA ligase
MSLVLELIQRAPSELDAMWAGRIINRNLRAGFDRSTFNKAFGEDAVKKFEVQLANPYEAQELDGEWCVEPKLDGNRVVGYRGQPTSRGNKIYPAAQPIFEDLRALPDWFKTNVPDGEMMGDLGFDKSSGALRRSKDKGRDKANFTYWVFDLFTLAEYDTQATAPLRERKRRLGEFFAKYGKDLPNVKPVPWRIIKNPTHKQIMEITEKYVADGFEGIMLKRLDAPATFDRSEDLLKVKLFFEDDFKVVGFYEGKGQHKGSLGGLIVEGTIKWAPSLDKKKEVYKIRSECGGGFGHKADPNDPTKVLRQDVWKNQKKWLGAIVQVQFQEPTKKEKDGFKSLRLPVFMMRRKDKE